MIHTMVPWIFQKGCDDDGLIVLKRLLIFFTKQTFHNNFIPYKYVFYALSDISEDKIFYKFISDKW